jgi:hypothetical protein
MLMKRAILSLSVALLIDCSALAQVAAAQTSNLQFQSRLTPQGSGVNAALTIHRDPLNRPCLDIEAASRQHVINPDVFDHVVSIYNRCVKTIKLRVCYYKSDHCIDMEVPPLTRKDGVLGIFPRLQYFRYSYQEKF